MARILSIGSQWFNKQTWFNLTKGNLLRLYLYQNNEKVEKSALLQTSAVFGAG